MAEQALVQAFPGVHVYIGGQILPAINMFCAGGDASRSREKGAQNIFESRQNGVATYTCTPGGLKCIVGLRIIERVQCINTFLYNNKCIYVYKCIYIRENEKNMPCSKKARCTCVCREMAYVHLKGAMYTWKSLITRRWRRFTQIGKGGNDEEPEIYRIVLAGRYGWMPVGVRPGGVVGEIRSIRS